MKLFFFFFIITILFTNSAIAVTTVSNSNDAGKMTVNPAIRDSTKRLFFSLGAGFTHFSPTGNAKEKYWDTPLFNMGGEALIGYKINKNISLSSGISYQYGKIALSQPSYYGDRTIFQETTFPFLASFPFLNRRETKYFITTGFYLGEYSHIKRETKGSKISPDTKWHNYPIDKNSPNFICDFYFGLSNQPISAKVPIGFELFFKYRTKDHWLNQDVSRFIYGIKIKHQFNFTL